MTAACAAIWLAAMAAAAEFEAAAAAAAAAAEDVEGGPAWWFMPTCDERFEVLVDGSVGSNMPCVAECLRECPLSNGPPGEPWVMTREPAGREKCWCCCRLEVLELACEANWA